MDGITVSGAGIGELSIPSLEAAYITAQREVIRAKEAIGEVEVSLEDAEALVATLPEGAPELPKVREQAERLRAKLRAAQETIPRQERIAQGLARRLRAAREVEAAKQAAILRAQVSHQTALVSRCFQETATALAALVEGVGNTMDAGTKLSDLQGRLAPVEEVLDPGKHISVGKFRLPGLLVDVLVKGPKVLHELGWREPEDDGAADDSPADEG